MNSEERKMARLAEENMGLKQYIDAFNKECLELQACLFEEANKIAQTAYGSQHKAELKAAEVCKENAVLKAEIKDLKRILRSHQQKNQELLTMRKFSTSSNEINHKERAEVQNVSKKVPPRLNSPHARRATSVQPKLSTSIINVTTQEPATRKGLLEALTAFPSNNDSTSVSFYDNVGRKNFKDFLAWIDAGCILTLPSTPPVNLHRSNTGESDVDDVEWLPLQSSSLPTSSSDPNSFLNTLDIEDVSPTLNFTNKELCHALRLALPLLTIAMEPCSKKNVTKTCCLVPGQKCCWNLYMEIPTKAGPMKSFNVPISSSARQRIAALADLFQYLSLIRRGLTGTPTTDQSDDIGTPSNATRSSADVEQDFRKHQFENVQRRRVAVSLARLGYGLPLME